MGYTIWYEGRSEAPITEAQLAQANASAAAWTKKLSDSAEDYAWEIDGDDECVMSGWTKPSMDDDEMEDDVDTLIEAVRALDEQMEGIAFTVTDDYDTEHYP